MTTDLTLSASRAERDQLADRTDVLDKVATLRTLPDDMHALTPMVAECYGVGVEAVKSIVKDNRAELESDGYRVVIRSEFERSYGDLSNLDARARQIALFPRRAILRIGMLLRDSDVARQVRDMLLDVERADAHPAPMSDDEIVMQALQIQGRKIASLTAKIAEDAPKVEAFDALMESDGTYSLLAAAKILGWGRNVMMRDLRRMAILQGNNLPYQRYEHHFKVVPGTYKNRKTGETVPTATTFVRPSGLTFLRKKLNQAPAVVATNDEVMS